ncbi:WD40 repeat domain-containing protein [bacterium]|nr:MAG: WD40 repeat domain-containing protein [bacterium]
MKKIMKKIILFLIPYLFYSNTAHSITDFANEDARLIIGNLSGVQSSQLKIVTPANITGWTQDSIVKSFVSNAASWTETYTAGVVIGSGRKSAPSNMVYNNSNAIVLFTSPASIALNRANSNVLANLPNNSSAIATLARLELNNSNDLVTLPGLIKTMSNAILNFTTQTKNQSNSIITLYRKVRANSQAARVLSTRVKGNSNALVSTILPLVRFNSNALISNFSASLYSTNSNAANFLKSNFPVQLLSTHSHFGATTTISNLNLYQKGIDVSAGKTLTLNTPLPINGNIGLNDSGILSLAGDLYLGSTAYLTSDGSISGNGYSLIMTNSLTLPSSSTWQIISNLLINGNGSTLFFGANAQITLASNVSLTLKNMYIQTSPNSPNIPILKCLDQKGIITLDNVTLELANDFPFRTGRLFFTNDVRFTGTSRFIYQSWMQSYVTPQSLLTFDPGTTLYYYPSSTNKDLLQLVDKSAGIYLKGSGTTLQTTNTGFRLTKGRLWMDNKITLTTQASTALDLVTQVTAINYGSAVNSVAWSPNRRYLAVGGSVPNGDNEVQVYSYNDTTLSLVASVDFGGDCLRVKWHPDGTYLAAVGGPSNNFKVYSFNGTTLTQVAATTDGTGNTQGLDWSYDGTYIAIGPVNATSTFEIRVYSFNGSSLTNIAGGSIDLGATAGTLASGVSWNPLGTILAIGANSTVTGGNEIRMYTWDGTTLTLKTSVDYGAANGINYIEFDPSGFNVAVGGQGPTNGNELQIYRFNGSTLLLVASVDYGTAVNEVHWDPSGRYLAVGGTAPTNGNELQFYRFDGASLSLITSQDYGTAINGLSWSADGATLAIGGQTTTTGHNEIETYSIAYRFDTLPQALTNGIIFGNSALGISSDLDVYFLAGARIELSGMFFYNDVN